MKTLSKIFLAVLTVVLFAGCGGGESSSEGTHVSIETKFGTMKVLLYDDTPQHRDNFVKLAKEGFYDGTLFHRVIMNFMVQGGDPNSKNPGQKSQWGQGGPGYTIPAEFHAHHIHKKGALAAARQPDFVNPNKESSGSQFYIVQGMPLDQGALNNAEQQIQAVSPGFKYTPEQVNTYLRWGGYPFLDMNYTVFGEVVEGMEIIDQLGSVPTAQGDVPLEDISMTVKVLD